MSINFIDLLFEIKFFDIRFILNLICYITNFVVFFIIKTLNIEDVL